MKAIRNVFRNLNAAAPASPKAGLDYWRERIYNSMVSAMLFWGLLALIPSVWLSFASGLYGLGLFDLLAYGFLLGLYFLRDSAPYSLRALLLILLGLAIGVVVFFETGDEDAGLFWMFAVPPFASLLLGLQWGLFFSALNIAMFVGLGYLVFVDSTAVPGIENLTFSGWIVYGVNFLAANAIVTVPLGALLGGLLSGAEKQQTLQHDYELLFDNNPLPMWVCDANTLRFLAVNHAAIEHYGYTREEFLDKTIKDIRPAEEIPDLEENLTLSTRQARQHSGPWKHQKKDGAIINVEIFSHSLEFADRPARLVLANDITERLRVQEHQRLSDQILQRVKSLILVVDGDGKLIYVSPSSEELTGYTPGELLGDGWWQLSRNDPVEARAEQALFKRVARGEIPAIEKPYERPLRTKSGDFRWIEWQDAIGPNQSVIGVGRDVTENKKAEQTLRRRLGEMEALREMSTGLRSATTLEEMLPRLMDSTIRVMNVDSGAIWLYDKDSDLLRVAISRGYVDQDGKEIEIPPEKPGTGLAGTIFTGGWTHVSNEYREDANIQEDVRRRIPPGVGGVSVPLKTEVGTIGVLVVNTRLPRMVEDVETNLLITLAEIAGNAIQRVTLHQKTEQQLSQFKALSEIDRAILSSLDLHFNIKLLAENVVTQLGVDAADVMLFDPVMFTLNTMKGVGFRTKSFEGGHINLGEDFAGKAALERKIIHLDQLQMRAKNPVFAAAIEAEEFKSYYAVPLIAKGELRGVLQIFHRNSLGPDKEWLDLLGALASRAALAIDTIKVLENLERLNQDLVLSYDATIEGWSRALDLRDKETEGHSQRVTDLGLELARRMGLGGQALVNFRRGALLHDIGKMGVPDTILFKPGKLTDEEWVVMKQHTIFARDMLLDIAYLKDSLDIPYYHHERWDGSGYPLGQQGEEIPQSARIFAVADVFDALTSDRPYRKAWTKEMAMAHIRDESGKLFDPEVVNVFLKLHLATKALKPEKGAML